MQKRLHLLMGLAVVLAFYACDKDIEAEISLALTYGGQPLVMQQDYEYPDGRKVRFTRLSFYLSDLQVSGDGRAVQLLDVDFVNLTASHNSLDNAIEGYTLLSTKVDLPRIESVSFNIGLTEEQNTKIPGDFPTTHPQSKPGEYWLAWDSFIFAKIEGWVDNDGDDEAETGMALHLGSDNVMREVELQTNGQSRIQLLIDVEDIFDQQSIYDIAANPQLHSLSQLPAAEELADNLGKAFTIKSFSE